MVCMPSKDTLKNCFENNPDGAGYMFPTKKGVCIKKGFMDFESFYNSLMSDYNVTGEECPYVMHFRIGTQGGNIPANTHPFPISQNIDDLRQLNFYSDVALAHNGIISLTTNYSINSTTSDTMDFITQYLCLIINESKWYKEKYQDKAKLLIERLIGGSNKLAIMSKDGHTELIGNFIYEKTDNCYYSNSSYSYSKPKYDYSIGNPLYDYDIDFDKYMDNDGWYNFKEWNCPYILCDMFDYCYSCKNYAKCWLGAYEDDDFDKENCVQGHCKNCKYSEECPNCIDNFKEVDKK